MSSLWKSIDPVDSIIFPGARMKSTYDEDGTPFAGELVIGDVVYKTLLLSLPCLVPGGLCSPPVHATAPCLVVLRLDATRPEGPCKGRGVIVYAHGNAVDIGAVAEEAKAMSHHLHCHVIVPEYPGYGVAKGKPCEDTVDVAVYAAVRLATEVIGAPIERVVMYGRSIGTGTIAAASARLDMMARSRPAAMILQSPFTSINDFARERAGRLLAWLFVSERWKTRVNLTRVQTPTLLIHGDEDKVISIEHSRQLRRITSFAAKPCELHVQKGRGHNDFDFVLDVLKPAGEFLRRKRVGPWAKVEDETSTDAASPPSPRGTRHTFAPYLGLPGLADIETKVDILDAGEAEAYPFANPIHALDMRNPKWQSVGGGNGERNSKLRTVRSRSSK